jgi:predicted DNA-binding WGR domain protein
MKYRRFETQEKCWEYKRQGDTVYRRWGPIGGYVKRKTDKLPSDKVAQELVEDLLRRRRRGGYREIGSV